jgi:hypothetical protein
MKVVTKKEVFILGERPTTQLPYGKYNTFFSQEISNLSKKSFGHLPIVKEAIQIHVNTSKMI